MKSDGIIPYRNYCTRDFIFGVPRKILIGINELSKEIIDEYYFVPLSSKWIFAPFVWKMFNTISREELPEKIWEKW